MKKNLKHKSVLVVGWEYPPRMVGGLAIATHGIVKALSQYINVQLIIPFKDKNTPVEDNVTVYGLNEIENYFSEEELVELRNYLSQFKIPQDFSVYPQTEQSLFKHNVSTSHHNQTIKQQITYLDLFKSEEVYGFGLWQRMKAFKEVVGVIASKLSFDMIHCHDWVTFEAGCHLKWLSKKPLALHVHALETDRTGGTEENEIFKIEKNALQVADIIFPVSQYTKECIINNYQIDAKKITPIHNAIEPQKIDRWSHKIPEKIVTFVGRLTSQKGPEFLFDTIKKVVSEYTNVRFVIAGSGDSMEWLMMTGAYQQLSKYIHFTGFIPQDKVNMLLATSDVYFMPSVSEPFGLTALEATRAGVSCVITKQSGAQEVLTSAKIADFWDTDKFAEQIIELLKNDEERKNSVIHQQEEMGKISWDTSAQKIAEQYIRILN